MVNTGFKKVICTAVTIAFVVTSIFSPGNLSAQPIQTSLPLMNIDVNKIFVNSGVASLEERFIAPEGPRGRTVIAIQNAHGIYDAQENIRALIQELQDKYNFNLVGLEGGAGKSDHTFLRTFPDKEVNRKVAESYMRRAELSGGEAAAILNPKPGIFYGVETPELYYVNRNSFLKAQGLKESNLHAINLFEKKLAKQREKIFPYELLEFHKAEQKYLSGQMPLWEFINLLGGYNLSEQYPGVLAIYAAIAKARQAGKKVEEARQAEEAAAKVEGRVLFEEIKNLSRNIEDNLSFRRRPESSGIQELLAQYHELRILRNLVSLELSRSEYEEYLKLDSGLRRNDNLKDLDLAPALQFYADAVKRDEAMYQNLLKDMKRESQNISIIIAGGFHTSGFAERLKKDGISFAVYSPRIHDMPKENKYLDVMEGRTSYVSTIEAPLPTMGLNPDGEKFIENYAKTEIRLKQQAGANLPELERDWRDGIIHAVKTQSTLADPSSMIRRLEKIFRSFLTRASQILEELKKNYLSLVGAQAKKKVDAFVQDERKRLETEKSAATVGASLGVKEVEFVNPELISEEMRKQIEESFRETDTFDFVRKVKVEALPGNPNYRFTFFYENGESDVMVSLPGSKGTSEEKKVAPPSGIMEKIQDFLLLAELHFFRNLSWVMGFITISFSIFFSAWNYHENGFQFVIAQAPLIMGLGFIMLLPVIAYFFVYQKSLRPIRDEDITIENSLVELDKKLHSWGAERRGVYYTPNAQVFVAEAKEVTAQFRKRVMKNDKYLYEGPMLSMHGISLFGTTFGGKATREKYIEYIINKYHPENLLIQICNPGEYKFNFDFLARIENKINLIYLTGYAVSYIQDNSHDLIKAVYVIKNNRIVRVPVGNKLFYSLAGFLGAERRSTKGFVGNKTVGVEVKPEYQPPAARAASLGVGEEPTALIPEGFWEDPVLRKMFHEKMLPEDEIKYQLSKRGVAVTPDIESLLSKIHFYQAGEEGELKNFHIDILAALLSKDPKTQEYRILQVLKKKGIPLKSVKAIAISNISLLDQVDIGRGKGSARDVARVMIQRKGKIIDLVAAVDKKEYIEEEEPEEQEPLEKSPSYIEYQTLNAAGAVKEMVPEPYLFAEIGEKPRAIRVVFKEFVPGIDLEDWFDLISRHGRVVPRNLTREVMYLVGRMFGEYYQRAGGWPKDMHFGNIIIRQETSGKIHLRIADFTGNDTQSRKIALDFDSLISSVSPRSLVKLKISDTEMENHTHYLLKGFESTYVRPEQAAAFLKSLEPDLAVIGQVNTRRTLKNYSLMRDIIKIDPAWDNKPVGVTGASLGIAPTANAFLTETETISPEKAEQLADDGSTAGIEFSRNRTALASRFARKIYEEYLKQSGREEEIAKLPSAIILRDNKLTYSLSRFLLHSYENAVDSYLERKRKTENATKQPFTENLEIVYRFSRDGDFFVFEILDNGIGEVDKSKTFQKGYQSYPRYIGGRGMADRDIMENVWAMRANKRLMNRTEGTGAVLEIKIPSKTVEDYLGQAMMGKSLGSVKTADTETSKRLMEAVTNALYDPEQSIRVETVFDPAGTVKVGKKKLYDYKELDSKWFRIVKMDADGKMKGNITHLVLNDAGEVYVMQIDSIYAGTHQKGTNLRINPQSAGALLSPVLDILEEKLREGKITGPTIAKDLNLPEEGRPLDEFLRYFRAKISPVSAPAMLPALPPSAASEAAKGASLGAYHVPEEVPGLDEDVEPLTSPLTQKALAIFKDAFDKENLSRQLKDQFEENYLEKKYKGPRYVGYDLNSWIVDLKTKKMSGKIYVDIFPDDDTAAIVFNFEGAGPQSYKINLKNKDMADVLRGYIQMFFDHFIPGKQMVLLPQVAAPQTAEPHAYENQPIRAASLGALDVNTLAKKLADVNSAVWIDDAVWNRLRELNDHSEVHVIKISGSEDEIKESLERKLKASPKNQMTALVLDTIYEAPAEMRHLVIADRAGMLLKNINNIVKRGPPSGIYNYSLYLSAFPPNADEVSPLFHFHAIHFGNEMEFSPDATIHVTFRTFDQVPKNLVHQFSHFEFTGIPPVRLMAAPEDLAVIKPDLGFFIGQLIVSNHPDYLMLEFHDLDIPAENPEASKLFQISLRTDEGEPGTVLLGEGKMSLLKSKSINKEDVKARLNAWFLKQVFPWLKSRGFKRVIVLPFEDKSRAYFGSLGFKKNNSSGFWELDLTAQGASLGAMPGRESAGEDEIYALMPEDYLLQAGLFSEKTMSLRTLENELRIRGVKMDSSIKYLIGKIRFYQTPENPGIPNYQLDVLASLLMKDPKTKTYRIFTLLQKLGLSSGDVKSINLSSLGVFSQYDVGRGKGKNANVARVMIETVDGKPYDFAAVVNLEHRKRDWVDDLKSLKSRLMRERVDEFEGMRYFATYLQFLALERDYPKTDLLPKPYLIVPFENTVILFKEYIAGTDLEDWFRKVHNSIAAKEPAKRKAPKRLIEEILYKTGRVFGEMYMKTGGWLADMHFGNIIANTDKDLKIRLRVADYMGVEIAQDDIASGFYNLLRRREDARNAFQAVYNLEESDEKPTLDMDYYYYLLAGFESVFASREEANQFFDSISGWLKRKEDSLPYQTLEDYRKTREALKPDPSWGTGPVKAASLGSFTVDDAYDLLDAADIPKNFDLSRAKWKAIVDEGLLHREQKEALMQYIRDLDILAKEGKYAPTPEQMWVDELVRKYFPDVLRRDWAATGWMRFISSPKPPKDQQIKISMLKVMLNRLRVFMEPKLPSSAELPAIKPAAQRLTAARPVDISVLDTVPVGASVANFTTPIPDGIVAQMITKLTEERMREAGQGMNEQAERTARAMVLKSYSGNRISAEKIARDLTKFPTSLLIELRDQFRQKEAEDTQGTFGHALKFELAVEMRKYLESRGASLGEAVPYRFPDQLPDGYALDLRKRLKTALNILYERYHKLNEQHYFESLVVFEERYPEIYQEASEWFGQSTGDMSGLARYISLLYRVPRKPRLEYTNPEALDVLAKRIESMPGRWLIVIDGFPGAGKSKFFNAIQNRELPISKFFEEMEFVEGDTQVDTWMRQILADPELPASIRGNREKDPRVLDEWAEKMEKKHPRPFGLEGPRFQQVRRMFDRTGGSLAQYKRFLADTHSRIVVFNMVGSFDVLVKEIEPDQKFPAFNVAKINIVPESGNYGDRLPRRLAISYTVVGEISDARKKELSPKINELFVLLFTMAPPKIYHFQVTEADLLDQLQSLRVERRNSRTTSINPVDMAIVDAFRQAGLTDPEKFTDAESVYIVRMAAKNFRDVTGHSLGNLQIANAGNLAKEEVEKWLGRKLLDEMKKINGGREIVPLYFSGPYDRILTGDSAGGIESMRRLLERVPDDEMTALLIESDSFGRTDHVILIDSAKTFKNAIQSGMMDLYLRGQEIHSPEGFKFKSGLGMEQFEFVFHATAFRENSAFGGKIVHMNVISLGKDKFLPLRRQGLMSDAVSNIGTKLKTRYVGWPVATEAMNMAVVHWFIEYAANARVAVRDEDFQKVKPFSQKDQAAVQRIVTTYMRRAKADEKETSLVKLMEGIEKTPGQSKESSARLYEGIPLIGEIQADLLMINFDDLASAPRPFLGMDVQAMARETAKSPGETAAITRWAMLQKSAQDWEYDPNHISKEEIAALRLGLKLLINDAEGGDFSTGDLGQMARARIMTRTYVRSLVGDTPQTAEVLREAQRHFLNSRPYFDYLQHLQNRMQEQEILDLMLRAYVTLELARKDRDAEKISYVKDMLARITEEDLKSFPSRVSHRYLQINGLAEELGFTLPLKSIAESRVPRSIRPAKPAESAVKGASLGAEGVDAEIVKLKHDLRADPADAKARMNLINTLLMRKKDRAEALRVFQESPDPEIAEQAYAGFKSYFEEMKREVRERRGTDKNDKDFLAALLNFVSEMENIFRGRGGEWREIRMSIGSSADRYRKEINEIEWAERERLSSLLSNWQEVYSTGLTSIESLIRFLEEWENSKIRFDALNNFEPFRDANLTGYIAFLNVVYSYLRDEYGNGLIVRNEILIRAFRRLISEARENLSPEARAYYIDHDIHSIIYIVSRLDGLRRSRNREEMERAKQTSEGLRWVTRNAPQEIQRLLEYPMNNLRQQLDFIEGEIGPASASAQSLGTEVEKFEQELFEALASPSLDPNVFAGFAWRMDQRGLIEAFVSRLREERLNQLEARLGELMRERYGEIEEPMRPALLALERAVNARVYAWGERLPSGEPAPLSRELTLEGHTDLIGTLEFSPDGKTLATGSRDGTARFWDVGSGRLLRTLEGHTSRIQTLTFSPDGKTLATGSHDHTARLWDVESGKLLRTLEGHTDWILTLEFSPDGKTLATGSRDGTARFWDVGSGRLLRTLEGHTDGIATLVFSPDGKTLATGSHDHTARLWEVESGRLLRTLEGHTDWILTLAFSPDGKTLATGSGDDTARLWDVGSGKRLKTLRGHTNLIWTLAFSPDGKTLATGSQDHTARLWEVESGRLLRALEGHTDRIHTLAFSPDGKTLATGSEDHTVRLWTAPRAVRGASLGALPTPQKMLRDFKLDDWMDPVLQAALRDELNGGKPLKIIRLAGNYDEVKRRLKNELLDVPPGETKDMAVLVLHTLSANKKSVTHTVVADRVWALKRKYRFILEGSMGLENHPHQFQLIAKKSRQLGESLNLHLKYISVGTDLEPSLHGKGYGKRSFDRVVERVLEKVYPGSVIDTLAVSEKVARWFAEYFSAKIQYPSKIGALLRPYANPENRQDLVFYLAHIQAAAKTSEDRERLYRQSDLTGIVGKRLSADEMKRLEIVSAAPATGASLGAVNTATPQEIQEAVEAIQLLSLIDEDVDSIRFTRNGEWLEMREKEGELKVFDFKTRKNLEDPIVKNAHGIFFFYNQKWFGVDYKDATLKVFDLGTREDLQIPIGRDVTTETLTSVRNNFHGGLFAVHHKDAGWKVIDLETREDLENLIGGNITEVFLFPSIKCVGVWYQDGSLKVFNTKTRKGLKIPIDTNFDPTFYREPYVRFAPNGKILWAVCENRTWKVFDAETLEDLESWVGSNISEVGYFGEKWVIVKYRDGTAKVFDVETRKELQLPIGGNVSHTSGIGKKWLVVNYLGHFVKVFDLETLENLESLIGENVTEVSMSPDGKHLAVKYQDKTAKLFNVETREETRLPIGENVDFTFYLKDANLLVVNSGGAQKYFDVERREGLESLIGGNVHYVSMSPDRKLLEVGYNDKTSKLFDLEAKEDLKNLIGENIYRILFSKDGKRLIVEYKNKSYKIFNLETRKDLQIAIGEDAVSVAFSPDGKVLVVERQDNTLKLVDLETGKDLKNLIGEGAIEVDFSPDGKKLVVKYEDKTRKLFDLEAFRTNPILQEGVRTWQESAFVGFDFLSELIRFKGVESSEDLMLEYEFLLPWVREFNDLTTDYNRPALLESFKYYGILEFIHRKKGDMDRHLNFYLDLIRENKRLALQVLEGVFHGTKSGLISMELPDEEQIQIREFVRMTNGFSPALYEIYRKEGKEKLEEILAFGTKILSDDAGPGELMQFESDVTSRGNNGKAVLLAVIQRVVPASGASFVMPHEIAGLFDKYWEAGDRRMDIPEPLKKLGRFGGGRIERVEWQLKAGETYDAEGKIRHLLGKMKYPDSGKPEDQKAKEQEADRAQFVKSLKEYVSDTSNEAKRQTAFDHFLAFARHSDLLKEKIDRIQGGGYISLDLLDQLFRDKDNLSQILRQVLDQEFKVSRGEKIQKPPVLVGNLKKVWAANPAYVEKFLSRFDADEIRQKVLVEDLDPALKDRIEAILQNRSGLPVTAGQIVENLFSAPIQSIETEKSKFEETISPESINLKFQVVKGPGYSLHGLNSGVCIATDIELWKNPNFWLLAMIDETKGEAVGFVHLFRDDNRLTVPGIEPSAEFLGQVKAREVYPMIMDALQQVARAGEFSEIDIPTDPNILSNRKDIHDLVVKENYPKAYLPQPVHWNKVPSPYPFTEVYQVPARGPAEGKSLGALPTAFLMGAILSLSAAGCAASGIQESRPRPSPPQPIQAAPKPSQPIAPSKSEISDQLENLTNPESRIHAITFFRKLVLYHAGLITPEVVKVMSERLDLPEGLGRGDAIYFICELAKNNASLITPAVVEKMIKKLDDSAHIRSVTAEFFSNLAKYNVSLVTPEVIEKISERFNDSFKNVRDQANVFFRNLAAQRENPQSLLKRIYEQLIDGNKTPDVNLVLFIAKLNPSAKAIFYEILLKKLFDSDAKIRTHGLIVLEAFILESKDSELVSKIAEALSDPAKKESAYSILKNLSEHNLQFPVLVIDSKKLASSNWQDRVRALNEFAALEELFPGRVISAGIFNKVVENLSHPYVQVRLPALYVSEFVAATHPEYFKPATINKLAALMFDASGSKARIEAIRVIQVYLQAIRPIRLGHLSLDSMNSSHLASNLDGELRKLMNDDSVLVRAQALSLMTDLVISWPHGNRAPLLEEMTGALTSYEEDERDVARLGLIRIAKNRPAVITSDLLEKIKDESIRREIETEKQSAAGRSLGAMKTEIQPVGVPPLDDDEVRYLAFKLGFVKFMGNQDEFEKRVRAKISAENIRAIGDQLYAYIMKKSAENFEAQHAEIEDFIRSLQKSTDQELVQRTDAVVDRILSSMSDSVKSELKPELIKSFTSTLRKVSKRVTMTEVGVAQTGEAEKLYQDATRTNEDQAKMKTAETILLKRLREATYKLMKLNEKTVIVTHPDSLPKTREEISGMFQSAFAAAPNDALLGRPLLQIHVIVTDENGRAVRDYAAQSPFAANIEVKRAAPADLARVFEGFQKRAKTDNLIFLLPNAKLAARESRVIQHEDSAVPNDLSFVKDALAEAAVGLARALKLPEGNREREEYLAFLQSELGISWKQDPESRRVIVSLNLETFVKNLLEIARAQRKFAEAA